MQETASAIYRANPGHVEGLGRYQGAAGPRREVEEGDQRLTPKQMMWKPEAGKWSIAEIVAHLADVEIVG